MICKYFEKRGKLISQKNWREQTKAPSGL